MLHFPFADTGGEILHFVQNDMNGKKIEMLRFPFDDTQGKVQNDRIGKRITWLQYGIEGI
jgi:hypothetical protein